MPLSEDLPEFRSYRWLECDLPSRPSVFGKCFRLVGDARWTDIFNRKSLWIDLRANGVSETYRGYRIAREYIFLKEVGTEAKAIYAIRDERRLETTGGLLEFYREITPCGCNNNLENEIDCRSEWSREKEFQSKRVARDSHSPGERWKAKRNELDHWSHKSVTYVQWVFRSCQIYIYIYIYKLYINSPNLITLRLEINSGRVRIFKICEERVEYT